MQQLDQLEQLLACFPHKVHVTIACASSRHAAFEFDRLLPYLLLWPGIEYGFRYFGVPSGRGGGGCGVQAVFSLSLDLRQGIGVTWVHVKDVWPLALFEGRLSLHICQKDGIEFQMRLLAALSTFMSGLCPAAFMHFLLGASVCG